jgi:hypothetical protein
MGKSFSAVRAPAGTPRFYGVRQCKDCGAEEIAHAAGQFTDNDLVKPCHARSKKMTASKSVVIVREARRVMAPACIRCVLCKLYAGDNERPPGVVHFEVKYNGDDGLPENPLCALTRRKYICDECIDTIKRSP